MPCCQNRSRAEVVVRLLNFTSQQINQKVIERDRLEVRVQFASIEVAKVFGILRAVVAPHALTVFVLCPPSLHLMHNTARLLLIGSPESFNASYGFLERLMLPLDLLPSHLLRLGEDFVFGEHVARREDELVQRTLVIDDARCPTTDVTQVTNNGGHLSIAMNRSAGNHGSIVKPAGWHAGERHLMPVSNVDDGVREVNPLDVIVDFLFHIPAVA